MTITDTTGNEVILNEDFKIIQQGFPFTGNIIYPQWDEVDKLFKANFKILFLRKGKYMFYSNSNQMSIDRKNFLFRDKNLI
jgi:hypothetical protein